MPDVETAVLDIVTRKVQAEPGTLTRDTQLSDLKLDSIDVVEIMFDIEETFDISVPYNANQASPASGGGFVTLGDVIDLVAAHAGSRDTHPAN